MAGTQNSNKGVALIYCRTATASQQAPTPALEEQAVVCMRHAKALGYSVGRVTKEVYSGNSVHPCDRPLFGRDWAELKAGHFRALIVSSLDRLARDSRVVAELSRACERLGVELVSVTQPEAHLAQVVAALWGFRP